jgi:hypothetical protein
VYDKTLVKEELFARVRGRRGAMHCLTGARGRTRPALWQQTQQRGGPRGSPVHLRPPAPGALAGASFVFEFRTADLPGDREAERAGAL